LLALLIWNRQSGVGPSEHLRQHNIKIISDLPGVGQNLHDKTYVGISFRVNVETASSMNLPEYRAAAEHDYLSTQTGPLTNGPAFVSFEQLPAGSISAESRQILDEALTADWPHVEYLVENGFSGDNSNYANADPADGYNYATISAALQGALSTGQITLQSSDSLDAPLIDPNYFADKVDMEVAIAAFRRVRRIWSEMSNVTIGPEFYPGIQVSTDEKIMDYIRKNSIQLWHASGTCKMGTRNDDMAVVDTQGRVYGVEGLRVVDSSIFPFLPPGHPLATVYALALKIGAQMIL
jgi:choline dehydrogenase